MATNEYKPSNRVVLQTELVHVETPNCKTSDQKLQPSYRVSEQTIRPLVYIADENPVVALLVGNDQLNEVKLKTT